MDQIIIRFNQLKNRYEGRLFVANFNLQKFMSRLIFFFGIISVIEELILPNCVVAVQSLPGSTWDQVTYDDDQFIGNGTMGYFNQGVDWVTLPGGITFNTFAEVRYRFRSENRPYYNVYSEAVGLELKKSIFHLGVDYLWERYPELSVYSDKFQYYLTGFYDWDLNKKKVRYLKGFPGSTWDQISYDADSFVGAGAMGYINQGVDWLTFPGGITFNTFAEFRYRFRSENKPYYNAYGEALGIEFKKSIFHLGADYYFERFPALSDYSNKFQIYLTLFYDWDLKPKGSKQVVDKTFR
jgi:hypothetical protein